VKSSREFPADVRSVKAARRFVRDTLGDLPPATADAIELLVSELATNSVKHAATAFELSVERQPRGVLVEVTDSGPGRPAPRHPGPTDPTGRGLRIVELMSDGWGIRRTDRTKTVWFLMRAAPAGPPHPPGRRAAQRGR